MARALVIAAALAAPALGFAPAPSALPRASCRSAPALSMRLGGGSGFGFRKGGVVRGKSWTKGIVPRVPGGGNTGGVSGGGGNGVARNAAEGAAEEPEPKAEEALGVWAAYEAALEKDPLLIKGLTSMIGFFLGDVLAQCFIEKSDKYDIWRTIRFSSFGLLVHGTTSHWFYGKLDGKIPGTGAGARAGDLAVELAVEPVGRRAVHEQAERREADRAPDVVLVGLLDEALGEDVAEEEADHGREALDEQRVLLEGRLVRGPDAERLLGLGLGLLRGALGGVARHAVAAAAGHAARVAAAGDAGDDALRPGLAPDDAALAETEAAAAAEAHGQGRRAAARRPRQGRRRGREAQGGRGEGGSNHEGAGHNACSSRSRASAFRQALN